MIIKLTALALASVIMSVVLKKDFKGGALLISVACCFVLFFVSTDVLFGLYEGFLNIKETEIIDSKCFILIIKMLAVAYVTSLGADICADSGEKAISSALEVSGKLIMLSMAFPMLGSIFKSISEMLG